MTINDYISENLNSKDKLPFDTLVTEHTKKTMLTKLDQKENNIYFLKAGIVEVGMEKEGEDRIIEFYFSNQFFSSYTSFLTQNKSDVYITCLTDCIIESISHSKITEAYKTSLIANQFGRHITEVIYMQRVKKEKDILTKNAEQRYMELIKKRPEVIKQIPISRIAKYLGIHPESLSRLRRTTS